jgi:hypothetical protein
MTIKMSLRIEDSAAPRNDVSLGCTGLGEQYPAVVDERTGRLAK